MDRAGQTVDPPVVYREPGEFLGLAAPGPRPRLLGQRNGLQNLGIPIEADHGGGHRVEVGPRRT